MEGNGVETVHAHLVWRTAASWGGLLKTKGILFLLSISVCVQAVILSAITHPSGTSHPGWTIWPHDGGLFLLAFFKNSMQKWGKGCFPCLWTAGARRAQAVILTPFSLVIIWLGLHQYLQTSSQQLDFLTPIYKTDENRVTQEEWGCGASSAF